jgi:alpha,alpha-trehalose phosphorylase
MCVHRTRVQVEIDRDTARYRLISGTALSTSHHGTPIVVEPGPGLSLPIPECPRLPRPTQPVGREPGTRH